MHRKQTIVLTFIIVLIALSGVSAVKKTYEGTISSSVESNFPTNFVRPGIDGFNGHLTWMAPVGTFARGPVFNEKFEVIKKGDVLAICDKRFYSYFVNQAKADIKSKKGLLVAMEYEFKRKEELAPTHAIPKSEYDQAKGKYQDAQGNLESAIENFKYQELLLETCTIRAAFNCYVVKHTNTVGSWTNVDYPTMEVMRISPMYVDIKIDRSEAKKIYNGDVEVSIYISGSDKPHIAYTQYSELVKDGIRIPVANHFIDVPKNIKIPVTQKLSFISRFNIDSTKLSVATNCIQKDEKGSYLWRAVGEKISGTKTMDNKFKVHKEYINTLDMLRKTLPMGVIKCLKDTGNLKIKDVILEDVPKNLKEGDTVYYHNRDILFWPGDTVKVVVTE